MTLSGFAIKLGVTGKRGPSSRVELGCHEYRHWDVRHRWERVELGVVGVAKLEDDLSLGPKAWRESGREIGQVILQTRLSATCGGTLSLGSQRHYLNSLSNLYKRAQGRVVPSGYNPIAGVMEKPVGDPDEAAWLEVSDAALLLESARTYRPDPDAHAAPLYPLIATFLLTGGRTSEVLGLELDDISFQRQRITFRPNQWRRLKSKNSRRGVPVWPQLKDILAAYFAEKEREGGLGRLVFPSPLDGEEKPIKDFRNALDAVAGRCGWNKGEIRSKMFRHTYCSARLQTLDGGAPVSPFTVSKELGHGGLSMMEQVYGHLGQIRHRSEVVEYRLTDHTESLGDRIETLEKLGV